jgi:hypothetical protein
MDTSPVIAYTVRISAFLVMVWNVHIRSKTVKRYVHLPRVRPFPRCHMSAWANDGGFSDCRA